MLTGLTVAIISLDTHTTFCTVNIYLTEKAIMEKMKNKAYIYI